MSKRILDSLLTGITEDPPSDKALRGAFWEIVKAHNISPPVWSKLVDKHVRNPEYGEVDLSKLRDHASRFTTGLTGGSMPESQAEFTWRRFIEGIVMLDVNVLHVTVKSRKNSKWATGRIVRAITFPKADLLHTIKKDVVEMPGSASILLGDFFANTEVTYQRHMHHVLSKLLWATFNVHGVTKNTWDTCIHRYIHDTANCPQLLSRRNDKKNNLQQAITRTHKLTWKRFQEALKAIDILELDVVFGTVSANPHDIVETCVNINLSELSFKSGDRDDGTDD